MKALVFGAGVIGSYIASKLFQSDVDVSILARGEKFLNIKEKGNEGTCRWLPGSLPKIKCEPWSFQKSKR